VTLRELGREENRTVKSLPILTYSESRVSATPYDDCQHRPHCTETTPVVQICDNRTKDRNVTEEVRTPRYNSDVVVRQTGRISRCSEFVLFINLVTLTII
jgi:hypothetical protein